jgi:TonB family protein
MSPYAFVAAWLMQSTFLGVVALALPALCRIRQSAVLTPWWFQSAISVALMPLLSLLVSPRRPGLPTPLTSFVDATTAALQPALPAQPGLPPLVWLLGVWMLGVLARVAWLRIGHRRLSALAERGELVERDPALWRACQLAPAPRLPQLAACRVPVIAVAEAGPCAFGGLRPRILVPLALRDRPDEERVAVYLHELTHVARSDVGAALADEVWRALFWWQPAVWWLLARLRLAREFEVDATVVERTGRVRPYVDALLWCSTLRPALSPSTQVGSRRHAVVQRVAAMCKGGEMSRMRKWMVGSVMVVVFGGVAGAVGVLSPLRAATAPAWSQMPVADAGPLERSAVRPTLDAPAPRRTVAVEPIWSDPGVSYRLRAHLVVDAAGRVAEARLVGPPATSRVPDGVLPDLAAARDAALGAVRQWQFEAPSAAPMLLVVDVTVGDGRLLEQASTVVSDGRGGAATTRPPLRIGGGVRPPKKILDVPPVYPEVAKDARVQGVVIVEAIVAEDGSVSDARVLRSIPLLDDAALAAVKQWRYTPTWLNGEAVPVQMVMTINFTLQ